MSKISLDDVWRLLRESAGADEKLLSVGDVDHRPFEELGYDSLAILEVSSRIEQEFGIKIHEDDIPGLDSPAGIVDYVNSRALTS